MKQPIALTILFLSLLVSTLLAAAAESTFGEGVRIEAATPIADILADPRAFAGRRVRIEGEVDGVCPRKGCWMSLRQGDSLLRVKVEDGVIVFPQEAVGARAAAEGEVSVEELSREQYEGWQRHLAEELGKEFDPASVGDGPYLLVQLQGSGAIVEQP